MVDSTDFWKLTSELFSTLIDKPKMQEKFLKKPPPKYVYDMIINTMGVTGFPKGLFTDDEMNPKFFDENPQNKLEIFQKTVDITKIVLNENFEIKTTNILKGEEPEKTNYFLQAFHKAATSGKDFAKFVAKYLDHKKKKADDKKKGKEEEKVVTNNNKVETNNKVESNNTKTETKVDPKSNTLTTTQGKVVTTRPQSGKKPDKIKTDAKEIVEEKGQISGKVPLGLISEKNKIADEIKNDKNDNKTNEDFSTQNETKGKIKFSKIGKFTDVTLNDNTSNKTQTKTFTQADLESLKNYVQEISKTSNPIGKIIDFLNDDVDSMNKELQSWVKEAKAYKDKFDEEVKRSDETLLPLQNELLELEETIRDEHMRIKSIKSRMIKNEQIIQNLINNVISFKSDK